MSWKRCRWRATKMVEGLEGYSYSDRLRILGLTTSETRFLRAVFKILKGFENVDPEKFFQVVTDDGRRGHNIIFKLFKKRCRLDVGRFKFANRVCVCARSGTGWMMMWLRWGQWMRLRGSLIITWGTWGGIFKHLLFSPADGHPWTYCWKSGWILVILVMLQQLNASVWVTY